MKYERKVCISVNFTRKSPLEGTEERFNRKTGDDGC